jgi:hypothetical protein
MKSKAMDLRYMQPNFKDIYEYDYIEVHHKVPPKKLISIEKVSPEDFKFYLPLIVIVLSIFS